MDANSMNKEEENQSPSVLKLKNIELENKLLLEKQKYILLQSELESSKLIASKHLDIYKNECMSLRGKMSTLENDYNLLKKKELKNQDTINNLLKKIKRVDKGYDSETQKNCENLKKNDKDVKKEEDAHDNAMENEGENTRVFVDLDNDSDDGMKHSSELESDDSFIVINSECKSPRKKLKSSSESICSSTMKILCHNDVFNKENHAQSGNGYTQSPGNTTIGSARSRYMGGIPSSKQKDRALERAEQLQKNIRNPTCVRPMPLSGSYGRLNLTKKFCMDNHLPDNDTEMILECKDGAKYEVTYLSRRNAFSRGWANFARAFRLDIGDVLVFELTRSTRFKVHIVKAIQEIKV